MELKLLASAALQGLQGAKAGGAAGALGGAASAAGGSAANFTSALNQALKSVSQAQDGAATLQRQFQMGVESVSLEDTMIAMQKAQIGFQAAMSVRNRLVAAYSDIMNMQV